MYAALLLPALAAIISLGVDLGRVQLVKGELQRAVDAAALYAAKGAGDGTALSKAQSVASANMVDGSALSLQAGDVQLITWANGTYTVGGSSPNGVLVTGYRTAARNNAVRLTFGSIIGRNTCDVTATSIAVSASGKPPFGVVGINAVMLQNNTIRVDSYASDAGAYGGSNIKTNGYVATNGGVTMTGGVTVSQDLYMLSGQSITANGGPSYGTRQTLSSSLSYPNVTSYPGGSTNLGNVNSGTNLGSGSTNTNYYCNGINLNAGQVLNINGPVTLYINGNCTLNGTVNTLNNKPSNFKIRMMSGSGVNISGTTVYADIYAPQSPANLNNNMNLYGRIICSQLSVSGSGYIHYDESLPALEYGTSQGPPSSGGSGSGVRIAR